MTEMERATVLGRVEAKVDNLDTRLHQVEIELAVVKATAITPRALFVSVSGGFTLAATVFGLVAAFGDRLWGG